VWLKEVENLLSALFDLLSWAGLHFTLFALGSVLPLALPLPFGHQVDRQLFFMLDGNLRPASNLR